MHPEHPDLYDVAVIGAGPTGLYAAFYAGMRNLRYDVGGYPAILGRDLVAELFKQAGQFGADFRGPTSGSTNGSRPWRSSSPATSG